MFYQIYCTSIGAWVLLDKTSRNNFHRRASYCNIHSTVLSRRQSPFPFLWALLTELGGLLPPEGHRGQLVWFLLCVHAVQSSCSMSLSAPSPSFLFLCQSPRFFFHFFFHRRGWVERLGRTDHFLVVSLHFEFCQWCLGILILLAFGRSFLLFLLDQSPTWTGLVSSFWSRSQSQTLIFYLSLGFSTRQGRLYSDPAASAAHSMGPEPMATRFTALPYRLS